MNKLTFEHKDYLRIEEQPLSGSSLPNWFNVLKENRFNIDWQFIPKALYVSIMILALSPFRWYEKQKYDPLVKKVKMKSPLFIVGHWRSGTTFLHYLLGQDPNMGYVSTFETMTPGMIIAHEELFQDIVKNHLPAKRPMDDLEMHANLPYEEEYAIANLSPYSFYLSWYFPRRWKTYFDRYVLFKDASIDDINAWKKVYHYFLKKICFKNENNRIMLKSLVNTARIKLLLDLFPNARFIHIYRNPYEVYMSTWKLYRKILPLFSFQHISNKQLDENILYTYQQLYKRFFSEKSFIPKQNLVEFSYQDFTSDPLSHLKKSYNKLRLHDFSTAKPYFEDYIEKHKNYKASHYTITSEIKNKVVKRWDFAFDHLGYDQ